jgi:hypothetical protein
MASCSIFETSNGVYNLIVRATAEKGPALEREFAITLVNKTDQPADTPTDRRRIPR